MAYPTNLTLGGSEPPKILVCGANLISGANSGFEDGIGDWTENNVTIEQYAAGSTTQYGEYVLSIEDDNVGASGKAQLEIDLGKAVTGVTMVLTLYDFAVVAHTYTILASATAPAEALKLTVTNYSTTMQQRRCHEFKFLSATSETFTLSVYAGLHAAASWTGLLFIDKVEIREVLYDWDVTNEPHQKSYGWEKALQSKYGLVDGAEREHILGWRFYTEWGYDYLDKSDEIMRVHIANGEHLIVFPHRGDDSLFYPYNEGIYNVDARWSGEYTRSYFGEVYAGHVGIMPLRGIELEKEIPYSDI